jgi:hypothetical protein
MEALLLVWIITTSLVALAAGIACGWLLFRALRGRDHPADGWGFTIFALLGLLALAGLALGLGQVGMGWAIFGLAGVNLIMQPLCAFLFAACAYKLLMAALGHVTYAGQRLPRGDCTPEMYQALRWYCVSQGLTGCSVALGLAWLCLRPLL